MVSSSHSNTVPLLYILWIIERPKRKYTRRDKKKVINFSIFSKTIDHAWCVCVISDHIFVSFQSIINAQYTTTLVRT